MALGLLRPMTDWEAMMSAKSMLPDDVFEKLCLSWEQGVLTSWDGIIALNREFSESAFNSRIEDIYMQAKTGGAKLVPRELPQLPRCLQPLKPFRR